MELQQEQIELNTVNTTEKEEQKVDTKDIGVYIWIYTIDNVDVLNQSFEIEMSVIFCWEGNQSDFKEYKLNKKAYDPHYNAYEEFDFVNAKVITNEFLGYNVVCKGELDFHGRKAEKVITPYIITAAYKINAELTEQFELRNFPFDCQDLQITLRGKKTFDQIICYSGCIGFNKDSNGYEYGGIGIEGCNFTEYDCTGMLVETYLDRYESGAAYSVVNFRIKLARKWEIYFWKIIIFIFIITLSTFLVYSLDSESIADKYSLLLTLLLTGVAFQFVIGAYIPNLPYLTILDQYA
eukprot:298973_1